MSILGTYLHTFILFVKFFKGHVRLFHGLRLFPPQRLFRRLEYLCRRPLTYDLVPRAIWLYYVKWKFWTFYGLSRSTTYPPFSRTLEQLFLTVVQNIFDKKIPLFSPKCAGGFIKYRLFFSINHSFSNASSGT